jgi:hypothetical protein
VDGGDDGVLHTRILVSKPSRIKEGGGATSSKLKDSSKEASKLLVTMPRQGIVPKVCKQGNNVPQVKGRKQFK